MYMYMYKFYPRADTPRKIPTYTNTMYPYQLGFHFFVPRIFALLVSNIMKYCCSVKLKAIWPDNLSFFSHPSLPFLYLGLKVAEMIQEIMLGLGS